MMKIGFTYDLYDDYVAQGFSPEEAAEFDVAATIDAVENALTANGYAVERIGGVRSLVRALAQGNCWDMVFNICEGVSGIGRESQVPGLLEAYGIPAVFSTSDVMALTMNKALAKHVVRDRGIPTADFAVVRDEEDVDRCAIPFPVFVKPLAEGTSKGISDESLVGDRDTLRRVALSLIEKFKQPALVETYLPGMDLTVGIVGSGAEARAIGVMQACHKKGAEKYSQSFFNKKNWQDFLTYELVSGDIGKAAADVALRSWRALDCFDGGRVDLRCDAQGVPNFIEVNPLAGLRPGYSDFPMLAAKAGMSYNALIGSIMAAALSRHGLAADARERLGRTRSANNCQPVAKLVSMKGN